MRKDQEELADKIKRFDVLKVEYGNKKLCQCIDFQYQIDCVNHLVYCTKCGGIVDPFEALVNIARHYERIEEQTQQILAQRRKILNYKPHLPVIKSLEEQYKAQHYSMVPCCPRCHQPFDLTELSTWASREYLPKIEGREEQ